MQWRLALSDYAPTGPFPWANTRGSSRWRFELGKLTAKLEKPGYVDKAPAHLVERDKAQLAEFGDKLVKLKGQLAKLG